VPGWHQKKAGTEKMRFLTIVGYRIYVHEIPGVLNSSLQDSLLSTLNAERVTLIALSVSHCALGVKR
jgi:hypothetical protein